MVTRRRQFGGVRRERSGRWTASYIDPVSRRRIRAPETFKVKADANAWLALIQADLARGERLDPSAVDVRFGEYATAWLADKANIRTKTRELYDYLLRVYLLPEFGPAPIARIDTTAIRRWHAHLLRSHLSQPTAAKAYRLLRQILETAVDDRLLRLNPCRLKGASTEKSDERQIPTFDEVQALADAIDPRFRAMVWLGALGGLRKGECLALARRHIAVDGRTTRVHIERAAVETNAGLTIQEPKTEAGRRIVVLPAVAATSLTSHLDTYIAEDADAIIFTGPRGGLVTKRVWTPVWDTARAATNVGCTFHDLRHFAGTLNAAAGATTKEAMARMGHASPDAALRYQHVVQGRDAENRGGCRPTPRRHHQAIVTNARTRTESSAIAHPQSRTQQDSATPNQAAT